MCKVAVITGGSSGIGLCTAKILSDSGCRVYEISRHDCSIPGITHITGDVTDNSSLENAVNKIVEKENKIDILINNAGFGISGACEFTDISSVKRILDVNLLGMIRMTNLVLPHMRKCKSGKIINLSSVAACIPIPFQAFYSVSKAAVNSYTMALANEVKPFGITVTAVMPGDTCTTFTSSRQKCPDGDDIYGGRISRSVSTMEKDEKNGADPVYAGKFIAKIALKNKKKPLYTIGFSYKFVIFLYKILPCKILNKLIGLIYAK